MICKISNIDITEMLKDSMKALPGSVTITVFPDMKVNIVSNNDLSKPVSFQSPEHIVL